MMCHDIRRQYLKTKKAKKLKRLLNLTILILIIGMTALVSCNCGSGENKNSDPYFDEYVNMFKNYCESYGSNNCERIDTINVYFDSKIIKDGVERAGLCDKANSSIIISAENWNDSTKIEKEILILHEFGHCVLDRSDMYVLEGNQPSSLMYYKATFVSDFYEDYQEYYLDELFSPNIISEVE